MSLNIVDIIIILFILLCVVTGFKKGFIRELISVIGTIVVLILSYNFMGPLASVLYKYVPFFDLGFFGIYLSSLNILVFQIIAFFLCFFLFTLILNIIENVTNVVQKIADSALILKGISSILGMIVGLFSGFISTFVILVILSVPLYRVSYFYESPTVRFILDKTPVMSQATKGIRNATNDIYKISIEINSDKDYKKHSKKYDTEVFEALLKYNALTYDNAKTPEDEGKLTNIDDASGLIEKYKPVNTK